MGLSPRASELLKEMGRHGPLVSFSPIICRSSCPEHWPCAAYKTAQTEFDAIVIPPVAEPGSTST
ncbi:hypothetical protein Afil01_23260 [Actinorhabdospora filicis]|uniref:Uncharacterized protein n=1 Tax=Actinorhabdospora filicis TaxID=1785913 RepID=A0A9W6SI34_9ACTN|nr:hypothetical protein [Actinorhabdospora filicis]GLZ77519.1 hypothetical protein Afil01_23260 [Actinorhabdospora filicis]